MRLSFGRPIGTAAIVDKYDKIMYIRCDKASLDVAKEALRKAASKITFKNKNCKLRSKIILLVLLFYSKLRRGY